MSVEVMSLVFKAKIEDIKVENKTVTAPLLKLVLLALADHANDEGESAYPSLNTLERKTALVHQSVINTLKALKQTGLILRAGQSRRGTTNYSLNVAMLKSLVHLVDYPASISQPGVLPLVYQVDSPSLPGVPEPSYKHPLNIKEPAFSLSKEDTEQVNLKVDYILENERKAAGSWQGRDKMPEPIRELLDVYVELTGQRPSKGKLMDWLQAGQEWIELGIIADDLRKAYKVAKPESGQGFSVGRPGSLTNTANACAGERRLKYRPTEQERKQEFNFTLELTDDGKLVEHAISS